MVRHSRQQAFELGFLCTDLSSIWLVKHVASGRQRIEFNDSFGIMNLVSGELRHLLIQYGESFMRS